MATVFNDAVLYSIPEEIIADLILFGIVGLIDLNNVSLVSKTFRNVFFTKFNMEQILKRSELQKTNILFSLLLGPL